MLQKEGHLLSPTISLEALVGQPVKVQLVSASQARPVRMPDGHGQGTIPIGEGPDKTVKVHIGTFNETPEFLPQFF
jgi:hypothetical protein